MEKVGKESRARPGLSPFTTKYEPERSSRPHKGGWVPRGAVQRHPSIRYSALAWPSPGEIRKYITWYLQ